MTDNARKFRFETLLIHGGLEAGPAGATTVPIVQSSSFAHATAEDLEDIFRGRKVGQVYSRIGNPTTESLERRLALLEGGIAAIATASGMAAITTAVLTIVRGGGRDPRLIFPVRRHFFPVSGYPLQLWDHDPVCRPD